MVNYTKIICNAGVAFFTTLAGLLSADAVIGESLPPMAIFIGALIVGGIQAGLAFFVSLKQENETTETTGNPKKGSTNYITLF